MDSLREWLQKADRMGELREVKGTDWNLEIGALSSLNVDKGNCPALIFDDIVGYPHGYRVLSCSTTTQGRVALTLNLPQKASRQEFLGMLREKLGEWEKLLPGFQPEVVSTGPVLENVHSRRDVDLWEFPAPRWHELDGGRYIGTGCAVITVDPETGETNLGTYRMMVHDERTAGLYMAPDRHGKIHCEKYYARGQRAPVAVSLGHHPLLFRVACIELPAGTEYQFAGAIRGQPVQVIREEITGLPVPADSEIVIAGWCPQDVERDEGPFGEWTGYYASQRQPAPVIEVERIYHRDDPIILGSPNKTGLTENAYFRTLMKSAVMYNDIIRAGIPDLKGVWLSEVGAQQWITISIKQRYAGQAKQAALIASQGSRVGVYMGRYIVVVDDDIDITNPRDVLWAVCTRSDPKQDIDIIRRTVSGPLDPMVRKPARELFNSRAVIDACKPFEWLDDFPKAIEISPALEKRVKAKWGNDLPVR